jgi:hypothetical protein
MAGSRFELEPTGGGGSATLTYASKSLSGDVNITALNTFFDGPSVALAAGTWLVDGTITVVDSTSGAKISGRLWDGTTSYDSTEVQSPAANAPVSLALSAIVVLAAPATIRIAAAATA